jgi:hypothetical protein
MRLRSYENEHYDEPPRFLNLISFKTTWTTLPTREEKELINQGETTLPSSIDKETGETINNDIFKQDNDFIEVIHQKSVTVSGFDSIRVMRTCSTFHDEIADMLYGRNLFVFDARGNAIMQNHWAEGNAQQFESLRFRIPGLEDQHGHTPTPRQVKRAIDRIFDKKSYLPTYAWEDPLLRFCYVIGRKNVQRLTKVKIEGHLQVCDRYGDNRQPAGLGRLMQIYTPVLKEVARNLRSLTLHLGFDQEYVNMSRVFSRGEMLSFNLVEDDNACGDEGKSDEEKLDSIVGRIVEELRGLKHIQLGDYKKAEIPTHDTKWGKSVRWMEIVKKRTEGFEMDYDRLLGKEGGDARQCGKSRRRGGQRGGFRGRKYGASRCASSGRGKGRGGHGASLT